jgi:hypothetical protein
MENDSGERSNLVGNASAVDVIADLRERINAFFDRYADSEFDLWKGGRSKAGRAIEF